MSLLYANEIWSRNYSYGRFLLLKIVFFIRNSVIPLRRNVLDFWGQLETDKCAKYVKKERTKKKEKRKNDENGKLKGVGWFLVHKPPRNFAVMFLSGLELF